MFKTTFDHLAQYFSHEPFSLEFEKSKEEYFVRTGKIFQDEPIFEARMVGFFEWFLFEKDLWNYGIPPIRLFQLENRESLNDQELKILIEFEQSRHSLFSVLENGEKTLEVLDLLTAKKWSLEDPQHYRIIEKGDVVDARLMKFDSKYLFTDSLWMHPSEARELIRQEAERVRQSSSVDMQNFLFTSAYLRIKQHRFDHVPIEQIYHWEPTISSEKDSHA